MSSSLRILIIVGACLLFALIVITILVKISNKKKSKKLQESLEKYKTTNQAENNTDISLSSDVKSENVTEEEIFGNSQTNVHSPNSFFTSSSGGSVNPLFDKMSTQQPTPQQTEKRYPRMPVPKTKEQEDEDRASRDEAFEEFLDEHAFSRKIFDKTLLEDFQNMSPEMKSIILGNIFDKFDEDK